MISVAHARLAPLSDRRFWTQLIGSPGELAQQVPHSGQSQQQGAAETECENGFGV